MRDGLSQVYLRPLDQLETALPLRGTEGTTALGRSPDGQWLLVGDTGADGIPLGAAATVKRVPLTGGPATTFAEGPGGVAWGPDDDTVVLGTTGAGLRLIRTPGGEPTLLTTLAEGEAGHNGPTFLPNGRAVLFYAHAGSGTGTGQVAVYDFETTQRTNLLPGTTPRFATTGHLIFWREGSLWAVPFDPDRLEVEGTPVVVVDGVASFSGAEAGAYGLAETGTLVYRPGDATPTRTLGWVNREGMMTTPLVESTGLATPQLSPDGTHVAFARPSDTGDLDIVVWDVARGSETRLTETAANDTLPLWTPDGTAVTFVSNADDGSRFDLYVRPVDLSAEAQRLVETPSQAEQPVLYFSMPGSWSPDGQTFVYTATGAEGVSDLDIWRLPVGGEPEAFLDTQFNERAPRLSPNGNWLAYVSNQAGEDRIQVTAFPDRDQVFPVSTGPGTEVVWSCDGRELFYRNGNQLWVVEVETEGGFTAERPTLLFEGPYMTDPYALGVPNYDVSLDGKEFLMVRSAEAAETPGFVVVEDWFEELKGLFPGN